MGEGATGSTPRRSSSYRALDPASGFALVHWIGRLYREGLVTQKEVCRAPAIDQEVFGA